MAVHKQRQSTNVVIVIEVHRRAEKFDWTIVTITKKLDSHPRELHTEHQECQNINMGIDTRWFSHVL